MTAGSRVLLAQHPRPSRFSAHDPRYAGEILMRKLCFFSLLMMLLFSGCLGVKVEETTSPTKEQVNRCRSEMYINPSIRIAPLGFKHVRYRDDAIWFKFKTDVSDVQKIFNAKVVDTSKFQAGFTFVI